MDAVEKSEETEKNYTSRLPGTVNWGTATVIGVFAGMLHGGSKEAAASVSKDAEVMLKLGSTPDKREQHRLMRDAMEKRFIRVTRGSIVGGVRLGMFTATFFGLQNLLAEKRGVQDAFNIAGAGSATAAAFGLILPGSLRWRARPAIQTAMEGSEENWSEAVEDLIDSGDTENAISLLESVVSKLDSQSSSSHTDLKLASVLSDLAKLYSSKGFSLKADELQSRVSLIKQRAQHNLPSSALEISNKNLEEGRISVPNDASPCNDTNSIDDDWEAIADRAPVELLAPQCLAGVSELALDDVKVQVPKRRGRGTFSYRKDELYSDQTSGGSVINDSEEGPASVDSIGTTDLKDSRYGTRHVLVLADFSPSTRTSELEKLFEDFRDRGVLIRWVNDTVALAVFRTPSIALEASKCIKCPFTVRVLDKDDILMSSISPRDLEPPRQRPETSARTAKRLIAQGMGIKLPSSTFGSEELRKQEEARKNRIITRQNLKDDAWGDD